MSALLFRSAIRSVCVTRSIRRVNVKPVTAIRHKWQSGDHIPSQEEQATGLEKLEYDALMAGVQDPWNMEVPELGMATRAKPNLVNSMFEERIVGCICEEEQTFVRWWTLKTGEPVRCECGRWFQLKKGNPTKLDI